MHRHEHKQQTYLLRASPRGMNRVQTLTDGARLNAIPRRCGMSIEGERHRERTTESVGCHWTPPSGVNHCKRQGNGRSQTGAKAYPVGSHGQQTSWKVGDRGGHGDETGQRKSPLFVQTQEIKSPLLLCANWLPSVRTILRQKPYFTMLSEERYAQKTVKK